MYLHAIDEGHALLLGVYTNTKQPQDVGQCVDSLHRVDAIAHAQGRGAIFVIAPDPGYPSPNSRDRQLFADLKDSCLAEPNALILLTRSPLVRAVITAVSWLSPPSDRWHDVACETFAEVITQTSKIRPESVAALERMERRLRGERRTRMAG